MDHMPGFMAGTVLAVLIERLHLDLESGSFDGDDEHASFIVGRAGFRCRVALEVLS